MDKDHDDTSRRSIQSNMKQGSDILKISNKGDNLRLLGYVNLGHKSRSSSLQSRHQAQIVLQLPFPGVCFFQGLLEFLKP